MSNNIRGTFIQYVSMNILGLIKIWGATRQKLLKFSIVGI